MLLHTPLRGLLLEHADIPQPVLHAVETENLLLITTGTIYMEHSMQCIGKLHIKSNQIAVVFVATATPMSRLRIGSIIIHLQLFG